MSLTRSKKALLNTTTALAVEAVTAACGLILPRLILSHFGSEYNGIVSSITQFISCVALLKSGIGSVTRAALYKPLAENDYHGISEVVNATESFLRKVALIFVLGVLAFSAVYPLIVKEFPWLFTFTLCLILSVNTFVQYYYGLTYEMLIQADQSQYIGSLLRIGTVILNTIIAAVLIRSECSIHVVKLGSMAVYLIQPIFYYFYARKRYHLDRSVPANANLISQRWNAFGHQLASFVNTNTDVVVATIFLGVRQVSVYSVFFAVSNGLRTTLHAFSSGIASSFGNMLAKGEDDTLRKRYEQFELTYLLLTTVLMTIAGIMYIPYVKLYTSGVKDAAIYIRPVFGILLCVSTYIASACTTVMTLIQATGSFKDTMKTAIAESVINIVISVILVNFIGLEGIIVGTIAAGTYKLIRYNLYISKKLMPTTLLLIKKLLVSAAGCLLSVFICSFYPLASIEGWIAWLMWAIAVGLTTTASVLLVAFAVYRAALLDVFRFFVDLLFKRKKRKTQ